MRLIMILICLSKCIRKNLGHHGIVRWMFNGPHSDKVDVNAKDNEGVTLLSSLLRYYDENYSNLPNDMNFLIQK